MFTMHRHLLFLLAASSAMLLGQMDPPTRVARLNYINGSVSFQPAGVDEWAPATVNRPLTTGDQLWVDQDGRAELHIGSAGLRLASGTAFSILNLDDRTAQIQITQGSLNVHVRFLDEDQTFEVDTPGMAFSLLRPGDYRIDADPDNGTTMAVVRAGEGEVTGGGQAFTLNPGQQVIATGTDQVSFDVEGAPGMDAFDGWCSSRIRREEHSASLRYVNPEMIGYQDLDDNGYWRDDPQYGSVWMPRSVPSGWAPYHDGHWAWIDPWGWTWVDDQPWGFAPFHYGRWAYMGGGWGWIPGPAAVRPVYAPAMVAWIGGAHWGVSLSSGSGGSVGWVPLGPREVYVPSYRVSERYFTHVNQSNTVVNNVNITKVYNTTVINNNVTNVNTVNYVNARAPNAVVAIPASALANARPVNQVARPVSAQQLSQAQVMNTAPVMPQRAAVVGHPGGAPSGARPPERAFTRPVVARTAPPPPPPAFAARQAILQQHPGQPVDPQMMERMRASSPPPAQSRAQVRVVQATAPGPAPAQGQHARPLPANAHPAAAQAGQPQPAQPPSAPPPAYRRPEQPQSARPWNGPPPQQGRPGYGPPVGIRTGQAPQEVRPPTPPRQEQQARPSYGPPPGMREGPPPRQAEPPSQAPQEVRPPAPPRQEQQARPSYGPPPGMREGPPPRQARPEPPSQQPPPQFARPAAPLQEVHPQPPPQRAPQAERAAPQGQPPAQNRGNPNNKEKEKEKKQQER